MKIIDLTAGTKSMWFDNTLDVVFCDLNPKSWDVIKCDWSKGFLPFPPDSFDLVVFDPPHLTKSYAGTGFIAEKYGYLFETWESDLKHAFEQIERISKPGATIIFKWNERQISLKKVLPHIHMKPLFGHTTGNKGQTIWMLFINQKPL